MPFAFIRSSSLVTRDHFCRWPNECSNASYTASLGLSVEARSSCHPQVNKRQKSNNQKQTRNLAFSAATLVVWAQSQASFV